MHRRRDLQIVWILILAGVFWLAAWQHEGVAKLWHRFWEWIGFN